MNARSGTASIVFFSGTGNTRRACRALAAGLGREGWRAVLREIAPPPGDGGNPPADTAAVGAGRPDLTVLAFPVFALGVPHIVRRLVRQLPPVNGARAAVLAVFGDDFAGPPSARRRTAGYEGGALDEAARRLARRGYVVSDARGVGFPHSFVQFVPAPSADECRVILASSDAAIASLAADLAAGRHERRRAGAAVRFASALLGGAFALLGRRAMGKMYAADERCTSCGWCARACPAGTIRMRGAGAGRRGTGSAVTRRLPRWGWRCEGCQRCINGCPEQAIQASVARAAALVAATALPYARWLSAAAPSFSFPGSRLLAWLAGTIVATVAIDLLLRPLERVPGVRRLLRASYTRKFRRYRGPGG